MNSPRFILRGFVAGTLLLLPRAMHAQLVFADDFANAPSPSWTDLRGGWFATNSVYDAAIPDNVPPTFTGLPFDLVNFAVDVDINRVADGGVWLRCDPAGTNGVLLVTGGNAWGSGVRGGNAGRSLYWHVITSANYANPPKLNEAFNVFTNPGVDNIHLRVEVVGNLYSAYVNGSTNATTTLIETNQTYSHGHVGLYDFSEQTFDNFVLQIPQGFGPYQLNISQTGASHAALSWTTNAAGWILESAASLSTAWIPVANATNVLNTNFVVPVDIVESQRFFRLHKQ